MDGHAIQRHADVQRLEIRIPRNPARIAIDEQTHIADLAAQLREVLQRRKGAIDIDGGVCRRIPGIDSRDLEPPAALCGQDLGNPSDQLASRGKRELAKGVATLLTRELQSPSEVGSSGTQLGNDVAGRRVVERDRIAVAANPLPREEALEQNRAWRVLRRR